MKKLYVVAREISLDALEETVESLMLDGYAPTGGVCIENGVGVWQAMTWEGD